MKKTSLDRQKTIDGWVKQTQAERKDHSKLSMTEQTLDAEKTALNEGQKEGVDQRKVWDGKVAEIKQAISAETKALKGARTRDSTANHPTERQGGIVPAPPRVSELSTDANASCSDLQQVTSSFCNPRFANIDYEHNDNNYDHDVSVEATAASSSTPRRNEGRLEPHLIPLNPTPSKLAVIEAFDQENHDVST